MSQIYESDVACPACDHRQRVGLLSSLNGERMTAQVARILDGTFERQRCEACGESFRPEHRMLYAHAGQRLWVVVYPPEDRPRFRELERAVELLFEREFASAPPILARRLEGVRPQLTFGFDRLAERLRAVEAGLEPPLLECVKMVAYRLSLSELAPMGPTELLLEEAPREGSLRFGVYAYPSSARLTDLPVEREVLEHVRADHREYERAYPELFERPFASAIRYLESGGKGAVAGGAPAPEARSAPAPPDPGLLGAAALRRRADGGGEGGGASSSGRR